MVKSMNNTANLTAATREAHAAATAQATHRIAWSAQAEEVDGMLAVHTGYEIRDCATGEVTAFVPSSEWATATEAATDLHNAGYQSLGFALARKTVPAA